MRDEIIDDILTTALEGGINYWSPFPVRVDNWPDGVEYASHVVSKGATIHIVEFVPGDDDTDQKWHPLTRKMIVRGINRAAKDWARVTVERFWDEHDAIGADVAVQYALFDEIVYG